MEVWYRDLFKQFSAASYISVQRVLSKFVYSPYELRSNDLMLIVSRSTASLSIYFNEVLHGVYMLKMNLSKSPHYRKHCVFDGLLNITALMFSE